MNKFIVLILSILILSSVPVMANTVSLNDMPDNSKLLLAQAQRNRAYNGNRNSNNGGNFWDRLIDRYDGNQYNNRNSYSRQNRRYQNNNYNQYQMRDRRNYR